MRKNIFLTSAIFLVLSFLSCGKKDESEITIGWIGVLTGEAAPYGVAVRKGTELSVEEVNNSGGIHGRKIKVVYEDDQADPKTGIAAMNKLISTYHPPVIIQAAASSVMLANIPIAQSNKIVYISPSCSNDKIKDGGEYIYRIWPSDSYQGIFIAKYAYSKIKIANAGILYINNDFGVGLKNAFKEEFTRLGGKVVIEETFNPDASDMRTQLQKITRARPEIVFIPSHVKETARVLRQARETGAKLQFIADAASFSPELLKDAGNAADDLIVTNLDWDVHSNDSLIVGFVSAFRKKFNESPDIYSGAGYDCLRVVAEGLRRAREVNSDSVRINLDKLKNFPGVTGNITFDKYGEVEKQYSVYKVSGGIFTRIDQ